jgi:hypothetical protein
VFAQEIEKKFPKSTGPAQCDIIRARVAPGSPAMDCAFLNIYKSCKLSLGIPESETLFPGVMRNSRESTTSAIFAPIFFRDHILSWDLNWSIFRPYPPTPTIWLALNFAVVQKSQGPTFFRAPGRIFFWLKRSRAGLRKNLADFQYHIWCPSKMPPDLYFKSKTLEKNLDFLVNPDLRT